MRKADEYFPRKAAELVRDALADTRVVVVNGPRQAGKSTLAEMVLKTAPNGVARFLDNPGTRAAAAADPLGFLDHDGLMLIDEVQRVPDLWLAIKYLVDRDRRPGRFLLTGSARLLALKSLPDALPGRSETIELWPLSQGEIDDAPDGFVAAAFRQGPELRAQPMGLSRRDYLARARRGGYPEAVHRENERRRERFMADYVNDMIVRDVQQVAEIDRTGDMRRLISLLADQTCGLLNMSRLASALGVTLPTVKSWIGILETIYLIRIVPAWSASLTTRAVSTPKVMFLDPGLAGHLAAGAAADVSAGRLIENLVLGELARQLTWTDFTVRLHHYRDRDQYEVDALLEDNSGSVVGVEVKAAATVTGADFRGLRLLQRRLGDRFRAGFVLYCGDESLSFGDGMVALPVSALWTTAP
ncbi:ATP-binding protein [Actinoplanes sp. NPDC026670]|uniref:ATP-binding protein n=1 Tax=Actinoplanes sp. NPDC026670 TaxID=3154700 RepID=UPI0033E64565